MSTKARTRNGISYIAKRGSLDAIERTTPTNFDLIRLSKSKQLVDLSPNTLRGYNKKGLPFHRVGKCVFISKTELEQFLKSNPA
jgi:hypothetical protein